MGERAKYENKNPAYRFLVDRFLSRISEAKESLPDIRRILDVGCAEGFVINYLKSKNPNTIFYGIDVDVESIKDARKLNPDSIFECKSVYDVNMPDEKFDLVLSLEILEHLKDFSVALRVLHNLNSEFFIFSVPREPFFRAINFLRGKYMGRLGNHPEHINTWGKREFKKVLSPYFKVVGDFSSFPWTIFLAKKI